VEDGKLRVFYTCNKRDENYVRTVAQRFGTLQEDGTIKKEEIQLYGNPEGYTAHFRDPNFFYRNGKRYFAMAAQRLSDYPARSSRPTNGTTIIYEEVGGEEKWKCLGEVKTEYYDFGYMHECPNILQFGDYDVMICCPQGVPHEELQFQNHCLAGYFVGHLSLDSMEMQSHTKFQELDKGFDFYSPQVFTHEGRHILVGWIGMPDLVDKVESAKEGWLYSLTMPRVLTLRQGHIYSQPVEEIKALRNLDTRIDIDTVNVSEVKEILPKASEVSLDIEFGEAKNIDLALNYGDEKVTLNYNKDTQIMTISREGMKLGGKGIRPFNDGKNTDVDLGTRRFKLFASQKISFNMFIDRSAVEIFFQKGEEVATFLIYPEEDIAPVLTINTDKEVAAINGHIWEMKAIKYDCE
jgi:beta-fructofuranosidase